LTKTRDEWVEVLKEDDCCVSPVLTPSEAAAHPHWAAQGVASAVPTENGLAAWVEPDQGSTPQGSAPSLGEHTDEVLKSLGLTDEDIDDLRLSGIVA